MLGGVLSSHHPLSPSSIVDPNNRISATGSPGSNSSSGNSSGSGGSAYMEGVNKSVRFSDREQVLATPDLPDVPESKKFHHQRAPNPILKSPQSHSDSHHRHQINGGSSSSNRNSSSVNTVNGAVNAANNPGDTDSNSDTGLSSLHSSSDEGTYVLDTLVWPDQGIWAKATKQLPEIQQGRFRVGLTPHNLLILAFNGIAYSCQVNNIRDNRTIYWSQFFIFW